MVKIDWESYYDEYEDLYDKPQTKKKSKVKSDRDDTQKNKKTRRVSKQKLWDEVLDRDEDEDFAQTLFQEMKKSASKTEMDKQKTSSSTSNFTPRGINVHTIKNVQIDFDGVQDIQKIQNTHNNKETYGIKFLFKSKNNTYRVIWFNQNIRERDAVYNAEFAYWRGLNK